MAPVVAEPPIPRIPEDLDAALLSPQYLADPYPIYERLRREQPVGWSSAFNSWLLARYDDVSWAVREPALSTSGRMRAFLLQLPEPEREQARLVEEHYESTLPFLPTPRHRTVKVLIQKAFTPGVVEGLRPTVELLVDRFLEIEGDTCEFMSQLANPLPIHVIGGMLGVPEPDRAQFGPWTQRIFGIFSSGRAVSDVVAAGRASLLEMRTYLAALMEERRRDPRDDLISNLVQVSEGGETLTDDEVLANCVTLYTAGHETTSGLIGNALLALLRHPDQLQQLRDRPDLITSAVEEFLRYDTSVQRAWRIATTDLEVGGVTIRAGDVVSPMVAAANRDPARFEKPDQLNLTRKDNRHISFGHGIHFCVGAVLARLETAVAINAVLQRFPKLAYVEEELVWGTDMTFRSLRSLPLQLR